MALSVYDSNASRLHSDALFDALNVIRRSTVRPLTETETSDFTALLTNNLLKALNLGEREPSALRHAALQGISCPSQSAQLAEPKFFFAR